MSPRVRPPTDRAADRRDALLALSRTLAYARQGGVLSDGLDLVLGAIGVERGCAYSVSGGLLELVGHRGLPAAARKHLDHLTADPAWFVAQTAVAKRTRTIEGDLPGKRLPEGGAVADAFASSLASAGWAVATAMPLLAGRGVSAVLVVAAPTAEPLTSDAMAFFETACNMLALGLAREQVPETNLRDRGNDVKTAQMAALGMLAVGFADDLRAPLEALSLLLGDQRTLAESLPATGAHRAGIEELRELVAEAMTTLSRAQATTTRLLAAVRESAPEALDLADLARNVIELVSSPIKARGITLEASLGGGAHVFGRREELTQLLMSLLLNASDACEAAKSKAVRKIVLDVRREGARVVVSVADSGAGVPPNLRSRIFDPFFTTKQGGLGLGLTLAKHAVVAHRGHIEVAISSLGGALFRILLPAAVGAVTGAPVTGRVTSDTPPLPMAAVKRLSTPIRAEPAPRPQVSSQQGSDGVDTPRLSKPEPRRKRILWIDDDDLFLRSIKRAFPEVDVTLATTAVEGEVALAAIDYDPPDRIFCDIGLPGKSGAELHKAIMKTRPDIGRLFVFVTGGVITPEVADYVIASGCPTLLKPVGRDEIISILERRMARSDDPPASAPTLSEAPTVPPKKRPRSVPPSNRDGKTRPPVDRRSDTPKQIELPRQAKDTARDLPITRKRRD